MLSSKEQAAMARRVAAAAWAERHAMSNLPSTTTGIEGVLIWVSVGEFAGRKLPHGPRIKIIPGTRASGFSRSDMIPVTLADPPVILDPKAGKSKGKDVKPETISAATRKKVIEFVDKNREALLEFWRDEINEDELRAKLVKV